MEEAISILVSSICFFSVLGLAWWALGGGGRPRRWPRKESYWFGTAFRATPLISPVLGVLAGSVPLVLYLSLSGGAGGHATHFSEVVFFLGILFSVLLITSIAKVRR